MSKRLMTWNAKQKRWGKQYRKQLYWFNPSSVGAAKTEEGSWKAANDFWRGKQLAIDNAEAIAKGKTAEVQRDLDANLYCQPTETIDSYTFGELVVKQWTTADGGAWEDAGWTIEAFNATDTTLENGAALVVADWESQSGQYVIWSMTSAPSPPSINAQSFYSNAANSSAQVITSSGSYITIEFDSYEGNDFIGLSSNVFTTTTGGTYWVGLTPAWALGNASISAGDHYAEVWNLIEKYNGSSWDAVPMSLNRSHVFPATSVTHVDTTTGVPDAWQSLNFAWKAGSSFPVFASAGDTFRVRAAVVTFSYSRTSPGTPKVVTITGNGGNYIHPYQISWYLVG